MTRLAQDPLQERMIWSGQEQEGLDEPFRVVLLVLIHSVYQARQDVIPHPRRFPGRRLVPRATERFLQERAHAHQRLDEQGAVRVVGHSNRRHKSKPSRPTV